MSATARGAPEVRLPQAGGGLAAYRLGPPCPYAPPPAPPTTRVCFAAAHVVRDPLADADPRGPARLDWGTTLAYRRVLWDHGLGVAEAMDTAQRGMGLDWSATRELIVQAGVEATAVGGRIACGAGTDQLPAGAASSPAAIRGAYEEQCELIEDHGAQVVLMASRALVGCARGADDYRELYGDLVRGCRAPVILHWLGEAFDPALRGYWGSDDLDEASEVLLSIIAAHADRIDGIKVSLLDAQREVALRRRLPAGVRMYTGDDFNYPELIAGDAHGHSDALLGIFDAIAPAAAAAVTELDAGRVDRYRAILEPTVALSRHIFAAPTQYYKVGIVFLAYLNGHQSHFQLVGGLESARSTLHLSRLLVLADRARVLGDPELAAHRMAAVLAVAGVV
ncbi:MAG: dihydrodipicolinate synthase family protein [Solirubrobacteraceae bacterium]